MKILAAKFVLEANENIPMLCDLENVDIRFGQECLQRMQLGEVLNHSDIEVIPSIYADAASSGVMKKAAFDYIEQRILQDIRENLNDLDGIYLHLHGASEVQEIGSGDHHILREVRKLVGPYFPIAIVCDPHGNLSQEYVENATIIRCFRESPHTDIEETVAFVCQKFIELIRQRQQIKPVYRKLALILGGEQSVSADEPVRSINLFMNEMEKDERILSASWHVGYIRHDCDVAGAGIVVIPSTADNIAYAQAKADELAQYVWDRRHEFHYTGLTAQPNEALQLALNHPEGPVFITDSGDNVTSGSMGTNTFILRQVLEQPTLNHKTVLFAAIHDKATYELLVSKEVGAVVPISVGVGYDDLSTPVSLEVVVKHKGRQSGTKLFGESGDFGGCVTVSIQNQPIDLIITDTNHPFVEQEQFAAAGVSWDDYDISVVKIGYAFPELKEHGAMCVMSLTNGATLQNTAALPFKRIMRPMFPIDDI